MITIRLIFLTVKTILCRMYMTSSPSLLNKSLKLSFNKLYSKHGAMLPLRGGIFNILLLIKLETIKNRALTDITNYIKIRCFNLICGHTFMQHTPF